MQRAHGTPESDILITKITSRYELDHKHRAAGVRSAHHFTKSNGRRSITARGGARTKSTVGRQDFVSLRFRTVEDGEILIPNVTYEAAFVGGVADLADFVGHVVVDFLLGDQLEPIGVLDVLVFRVIVVFHWRRFDRVQGVEEVRERHDDRLV